MKQLPAAWRWASIDEVAGGIKSNVVIGPFGSSLKVSDYRESGVPLIFVRNIRARQFDQAGARFVSREKAVELQAHEVLPGDVLITKMGDPPGDAAVYPDRPAGLVTADCIRLRPGPAVDSRFLAYAFDAPVVRQQFQEITRGVAQQKVSLARLRQSVVIPLPSLEEQRRIVDLLEDHLSRLHAAERYLRSVVVKGGLARGAVFQAALLGAQGAERGDVAALAAERARRCPPDMKRGRPQAVSAADVALPWAPHWPTVSLEEATDPVRTISYGILKPGPNIESGVPYVRVLNMRNDVLALDDLHRTSPTIAAQYARASLEPADVLVSIRGTYGRVVLVPDELKGANVTQDTARVALLPQLRPDFVALVLRSPWAQHHLKKVARGVGVKGVNIADLREVPVPLPNLEVQARIVDHVEELTSDLEAANQAATVGLRRAGSLRRSLLAAAFSGDLIGARASSEGCHV